MAGTEQHKNNKARWITHEHVPMKESQGHQHLFADISDVRFWPVLARANHVRQGAEVRQEINQQSATSQKRQVQIVHQKKSIDRA